MPRFFKSMAPAAVGETVELTGQDAVHIGRSLRLKVGDPVLLCDGKSTEYDTVIDTITATAVDSPAGSPISVDFTVQVSSDGHDSLADYGDGFFLLAPSVEVEGNHLSVHARLGCNGGFASGNAVLVAYENGRFLGCAIADCTVYTGEFYELEAEISLSAALAGVPEVKLFLLERDSFAPATGFVPLTVSD